MTSKKTTPATNVASAAAVDAAKKFWAAMGTLEERRTALGTQLVADGFDVKTDFAAKAAKDAGRADKFEAIKFLAAGGLPAPVATALRDAAVPGTQKIKAGGQTLSKTEWSKRLPGKIRDLKNAFDLFLKSDAPADKKGAKANAPRDIGDRVAEELAKLIKAVRNDANAEAPKAKFGHGEMIAALTRAADLTKMKK